jgi:hypothetical protein
VQVKSPLFVSFHQKIDVGNYQIYFLHLLFQLLLINSIALSFASSLSLNQDEFE